MAFYKDMDRNRKKDHASEGSWDDEGTHYRTPAKGGYVQRSSRPAAPRGFRGPDGYKAGGDKPDYQQRTGGAQGEKTYGRPSAGEKTYGRPATGSGFRPSAPKPAYRPRPAGTDGEKRVYGHPAPRSDFRSDSLKTENRARPSRPEGERRQYGRPVPAQEYTPQGPAYKRHEYRPNAPVPAQEYKPQEPAYKRHEYKPVQPAPAPLAEESIDPMENLLSGRNPIREAIKSGRDIEKLLVAKGDLSGSAREIISMAREARIPVQEVERSRLDEITKNHQGMLAFASAYQYAQVEDMLNTARENGEDPFLILLDGITDPHNLGAVIRTAECVGAHGVIVPERRSVGLSPAAVKASAGAVEHVKVARVGNLTRTLEDLQAQGLWIAAAVTDGEDFRKSDLKGPLALVIGSEGEGISRLVLSHCDKKVSLPMKGKIGSLNASVAAGILMYAILAARNDG